MIAYGSTRIGALIEGDSACKSISANYLTNSNQVPFVDELPGQLLFCTPDPAAWLIPAVSKYLSTTSSVGSASVSMEQSDVSFSKKRSTKQS